jgi:hypothetical protein
MNAISTPARKRRTRPNAIADLPFVRDQGGGQGLVLWSVKPTGDYVADCNTGQAYAAVAMPLLTGADGGWLLALIFRDMARHGDTQGGVGVITGFAHELQRHLIRRPDAAACAAMALAQLRGGRA